MRGNEWGTGVYLVNFPKSGNLFSAWHQTKRALKALSGYVWGLESL